MSEMAKADLPIDKIRAYCVEQPILRLSLFGSALRDELLPESDIDLLVEYVPGARIGYFIMAQQAIDLSEIIGRPVDLHTPKSLSRHFRQQVISSSRQLYAR